MNAHPDQVATVKLVDVLRELHPRGRVLMERTHGSRHLCPQDAVDLMRVGVTNLAYTFEVCDCGTPANDHLVEQLWHRTCLTAGGGA